MSFVSTWFQLSKKAFIGELPYCSVPRNDPPVVVGAINHGPVGQNLVLVGRAHRANHTLVSEPCPDLDMC